MENNLQIATFDLSRPEQSLKVAEILQKFVKEKNLTSNIKGKQYPLVEAWCFAGSQLGLYPLLVKCERYDPEDNACKYWAEVEVRRISDDKIMSRGVAICSSKEASKRNFDEYAILSMAQTRAEGKAFRMLLSWLMKAAGFEATPAEEMDFKVSENHPEQDFESPDEGERQLLRNLVYSSTLGDFEKELALQSIEACGDYKQYDKIKHRLEDLQQSFDEIPNPNQSDIKKQVRKIAGNGVK